MQTNPHNRKDGLKLALVVFVTLGVATSGLFSQMQTAAAVSSSANLWAVPVSSRIDDGNYQILRLKFNLETANPLQKIRITLDEGTSEEKVFEFDGNGNIITPNAAFVSVDGSIKFVTDGYTLSKLKGKFKIMIDKTQLTVGEHDALAEVITTGETVSDDAHFKLRAGSSGNADLTPRFFGAPDEVKDDKKYNAFVKAANDGTGNAGEFKIKIILSEDTTIDGGDTVVGEKEVEGLKAGKVKMVPVKFEIPEGYDLGLAHLIVYIDAEDDVSESNEGNNTQPEVIHVVA